MNTLLSFLQTHYSPQLNPSVQLTTDFNISDEDCTRLSKKQAREIVEWVVQQNWRVAVKYQYEGIRYLTSPGVNVLDCLAKNGHADQVAAAHTAFLSATNHVIVAHILQIARNAYGLSSDHAQSVIVSALKQGDPDLISENFVVWMHDRRVASQAMKVLQENNGPIDQALLEINDRIYSALIHNVWDNDDEQISQWVSGLMRDIKFSDVIETMSAALEYAAEVGLERREFIEQKVQEMLNDCSLECAKNYIQKAKNSSQVDRLLPLFPDRFKYELAHDPRVEHTPNAQDIRTHGTVYEAVLGFGARQSLKKL